jgi:aquaporin Z
MVMAIILAIGAVSGAHLNPVVSVAFTLRHEFPWKRIVGYVAAQPVTPGDRGRRSPGGR